MKSQGFREVNRDTTGSKVRLKVNKEEWRPLGLSPERGELQASL